MRIRNLYQLACLVAAVLGTAACVKEEAPSQLQEKVTVVGALEEDDATKTMVAADPVNGSAVSILWTPGDAIGVYGTASTRGGIASKNSKFTTDITEPSNVANFSGLQYQGESLTKAYYPYVEGTYKESSIPMYVSPCQHYEDMASISAADIKAANTSSTVDGIAHFDFKPMMTLVRIKVDFTGMSQIASTEKIRSISIHDEDGTKIAGGFTLNLTKLTLTAASTAETELTVRFKDQPLVGDGEVYSYACIAPGFKSGKKLYVVAETDKHLVSCYLTLKNDYVAGKYYNLNFVFSKATAAGNGLTVTNNNSAPTITSFKFTTATNEGKILDKEVYYNGSKTVTRGVTEVALSLESDGQTLSACIPYLYDYDLVATFATSSSTALVCANGATQESGKTINNFASEVVYTVSDPSTHASRDYYIKVYNTGLPVVVLEQASSVSAGENDDEGYPINEMFGNFIPLKDSEWNVDDVLTIYNSDGTIDVDHALCGFRQRGNITRDYPKKAMAVKFVEKQKVLGMNKHKRWCLLANWKDRSMLRNTVALALADVFEDGNGIGWNPNGKNVELVYNGIHVGNYYLCEQIKIDKNRVNTLKPYADILTDYNAGLVADAPTYETCGYLIEVDDYYDEPYRFKSTYLSMPFMFKDDFDDTQLGQSIYNSVQSFVNSAERAIYYNWWDEVYSDYIDRGSFIDYLIINEIVMNNEYKHPKSLYLNKSGNGKLFAGPVWDFDYRTFPNITEINSHAAQGLGQTSSQDYTKLQFKNSSNSGYKYFWYRSLIQDPNFVAALKARWNELYSSGKLPAFANTIRELGEQNRISDTYNHAMWPVPSEEENDYYTWFDYIGDEFYDDYQDVIDNLVTVYNTRIEGLNSAINSL